MGYQRSNRVFAVLALCGAWGCAQIAGLTGNYQEGATGTSASGGVAEGQAGGNASAGHGMSQGGSSSSHGGMSGGPGGDAGNQAGAGEAGMSEVGGAVSSAGHAGTSTGHAGASSGSGGAPSGGAPSGGAPSGGAPSAGAPNSGDCKDDADCASVGGKCVSLSPGGFRTCQVVVPLATTCNSGSDECCTDGTEPCVTGRCVRGPLGPHCGGPFPVSANVCATLGCTTNADCNDNETCILAGTLDHLSNSCVPGGCRVDSDCTVSAGGKCKSVTPNCCSGALGLYCVYPTGGCRTNSDCPGGHCFISADNVTAACVTGKATCPL
jgi:hypothetical protein